MLDTDTSGCRPVDPVYPGLIVDDWTVLREAEGAASGPPHEESWLCACHCGATKTRTTQAVMERVLPACSACLCPMPEELGQWAARDSTLRRALIAAGF